MGLECEPGAQVSLQLGRQCLQQHRVHLLLPLNVLLAQLLYTGIITIVAMYFNTSPEDKVLTHHITGLGTQAAVQQHNTPSPPLLEISALLA